jgi:hypothetical protein
MVTYLQALWQLLRFHFHLERGDFATLYETVRVHPRRLRPSLPPVIERACTAMDVACFWYPKQVLCLQRSAATACLLRNHGVPAQMVIGVREFPFSAHAWVEVEGRTINDKPYTREMYTVLACC